jgi:hypothetical protein
VYRPHRPGLATNFDQNSSFGMSTSLSSPFGALVRDESGARFVNTTTMPPTCRQRRREASRRRRRSRRRIYRQPRRHDHDAVSSHVFNFLIGRELRGGFALEAAYVGRRSAATCSCAATWPCR